MKRALKGDSAILRLLVEHSEGLPEQRITLDTDPTALDRLFERLAPKTGGRSDSRGGAG
jgi:hypothetical protein